MPTDDELDPLRGATYFSSLVLRSGYWQIPMADGDQEKTAFITPDGLFNVLPFGLSNAPTHFDRTIGTVLRGLRWKAWLCSVDDIAVYSATFSERIRRLNKLISCLAPTGLQLNRRKCRFPYKQIDAWPHCISARRFTRS